MKRLFDKIGTTEIRNILAIVTILGCFILLYLLQIKSIPVANKEVLNTAIGFVFGGMLSGVSGYYFGASKTDKNENKNL